MLTNQVCEVRLIPSLKLFHFREYGPILFLNAIQILRQAVRVSRIKVFIYILYFQMNLILLSVVTVALVVACESGE